MERDSDKSASRPADDGDKSLPWCINCRIDLADWQTYPLSSGELVCARCHTPTGVIREGTGFTYSISLEQVRSIWADQLPRGQNQSE